MTFYRIEIYDSDDVLIAFGNFKTFPTKNRMLRLKSSVRSGDSKRWTKDIDCLLNCWRQWPNKFVECTEFFDYSKIVMKLETLYE